MNLREFQGKYQLSNTDLETFFDCSLSTIVKWKAGRVQMPGHVRKLIVCADLIARGDSKTLVKICALKEIPSAAHDDDQCNLLWNYLTHIAESKSNVMVMQWRPDTTVMRVSPNFEEKLKVPAGFLCGRRWLGFISDHSATQAILPEVSGLIRSGGTMAGSRSFRSLDGNRFQVDSIDFAIRDNTGGISIILSMLIDRTSEEEAIRSNFVFIETLDLLLASTSTLQIIAAANGEILGESAASKQFRTSINLDSKTSIFDLFESPKGADFKSLLTDASRQRISYKGRLLLPDGKSTNVLNRFHATLTRFRWMGDSALLVEYAPDEAAGRAPSAASEVLRQRMAIEGALVLNPSVNSRSAPSFETDNSLNALLGQIAKRFHATRAYIFQTDVTGDYLSNTHEWCSPEVSPQIDGLQNAPFSATPWWRDRLRKNQPVVIPSVANMPPEAFNEKKILVAQDIMALVAVPLIRNERLAGFLGLDFGEEFSEPPDTLLDELNATSAIVTGSLAELEETTRSKMEFNQLQGFLNIAGVAWFDWDVTSGQIYFSPQTGRLVGLEVESHTVMGDGLKWWIDQLHPDDRPLVKRRVENFLTARRDFSAMSYRLKVDGQTFNKFIEYDIPTRFDVDGSIAAVRGYLINLDTISSLYAGTDPETGNQKSVLSLAHATLGRLLDELKPITHAARCMSGRLRSFCSADPDFTNQITNPMDICSRLQDLVWLTDFVYNPEQITWERFTLDTIEAGIKQKANDAANTHPARWSITTEGYIPSLLSGDTGKIIAVAHSAIEYAGKLTQGQGVETTLSAKTISTTHVNIQISIKAAGTNHFDLSPAATALQSSASATDTDIQLIYAAERLRILGGNCKTTSYADGGQGILIEIPAKVEQWDASNRSLLNGDQTIRLLIVDDHAASVQTTIEIVENTDPAIDCIWARNGREALQWCGRNQPTFILLDLNMPIMDGLNFLDLYNSDEFTGHRAAGGVIVASAYIDGKALRSMARHNVLRSFTKPYSIEELARFLRQSVTSDPRLELVDSAANKGGANV